MTFDGDRRRQAASLRQKLQCPRDTPFISFDFCHFYHINYMRRGPNTSIALGTPRYCSMIFRSCSEFPQTQSGLLWISPIWAGLMESPNYICLCINPELSELLKICIKSKSYALHFFGLWSANTALSISSPTIWFNSQRMLFCKKINQFRICLMFNCCPVCLQCWQHLVWAGIRAITVYICHVLA